MIGCRTTASTATFQSKPFSAFLFSLKQCFFILRTCKEGSCLFPDSEYRLLPSTGNYECFLLNGSEPLYTDDEKNQKTFKNDIVQN